MQHQMTNSYLNTLCNLKISQYTTNPQNIAELKLLHLVQSNYNSYSLTALGQAYTSFALPFPPNATIRRPTIRESNKHHVRNYGSPLVNRTLNPVVHSYKMCWIIIIFSIIMIPSSICGCFWFEFKFLPLNIWLDFAPPITMLGFFVYEIKDKWDTIMNLQLDRNANQTDGSTMDAKWDNEEEQEKQAQQEDNQKQQLMQMIKIRAYNGEGHLTREDFINFLNQYNVTYSNHQQEIYNIIMNQMFQ